MIDTLYDKFINWSNKGSVYIYSDPHFADTEMKYLRNNYIGDEEQIKRINNVVHKNDTLIILGDIGDINYIPKLKAGYKVLIKGNHDKGKTEYLRQITYEKEWLYEDEDKGYWFNSPIDNHLFDEVYEGPIFISDKILLSHEPVDLPFCLNIHGHDHSGWYKTEGPSLNVCAELIDYTPVNLGKLIKSGALSKVPSIHRMAIDKQIKRKKEKINFIEEFNKRKVSKEFLDTCKKAGELFKKTK